jgi:type I restriction enzyme R subunit
MAEPLSSRVQVFDPHQSFGVFARRLPHWSQAGTISFITWRTWDSIPKHVLAGWLSEREAWLKQHGIGVPISLREMTASRGARGIQSNAQLQCLGEALVHEYQRKFSDRWHEHLDDCHGACVLKQPVLSRTVVDSLRHFDGERYVLTDYVVMPNHVHVLVAFPDESSMLRQCESWKHFTATQINKALGRKGRFWQQDGFDHLVRSIEQYEFLRRYIAENPKRAKLTAGEYVHESKPM